MSRACEELAELRSGLVDGALAPADREQVVAHLLGCATCRAEVAELRAVRELLGRTQHTSGPPPHELSSRLVSIAGEAHDQPMWTSAFGTRTGTLPSERRRHQLRTALSVLAVSMVITLVGFTGWAAAPAADLAPVADPVDEARAEFGAAVGELSPAGTSLGALMMLDLLGTGGGAAVTTPADARGAALSPDEARGALQRAATSASTVSLVGRQTLTVSAQGRRATATVDVDTRQGQGPLSLLGPTGRRLATLFAPASRSTVPQQEVFAVLSEAYTFTGRAGAVVAQRRASVVEAWREGRLAKRWWVDDDTGVLLWQETYDARGEAVVSTGFERVRLDRSVGVLADVPPRTATAGLTTTAVAGGVEGLRGSEWSCTERLAGLSLLELSTDTSTDPRVVHSVYGDGLSTLSVLQQRGLLDVPVGDAVWDGALGAWRHDGAVTWATWQSGDTVFTVATDGPAALLADAVASLPREEPVATTTLGRVRDGWSKLLADSKG